MDKYEMILDYINTMDDDDVINAWNCNYGYGAEIHYISELDGELDGLSPTEICELATDCDFSSWHDYFTYEVGELRTSESLDELVDLGELADYIIDNDDDLDDEEIRAMLDADEEGDDEDEE